MNPNIMSGSWSDHLPSASKPAIYIDRQIDR